MANDELLPRRVVTNIILILYLFHLIIFFNSSILSGKKKVYIQSPEFQFCSYISSVIYTWLKIITVFISYMMRKPLRMGAET